jgi:hypothetical protein
MFNATGENIVMRFIKNLKEHFHLRAQSPKMLGKMLLAALDTPKPDMEKVHKILKYNPSLKVRDGLDRTPMHLATWHANMDAVDALAAKGATLDDPGKFKVSPRETAEMMGHTAFLARLAKKYGPAPADGGSPVVKKARAAEAPQKSLPKTDRKPADGKKTVIGFAPHQGSKR